MKDIVIGCITGYDFEKIKPWVNSLDRCGFDGVKAMVCYNVSYETVEELVKRKRFDVRLIYNTNFTHTDLRGRSVFDKETSRTIPIYCHHRC